MNSLIEWLSLWGGRFVDVALPLLWQSSLLIVVLLAFDFLLRRKIRAAVRYSLWFAVFLKLLLPPTLALPTGAAWWLRNRPVPVVVHHSRVMSVNYTEPVASYLPPETPVIPVTPPTPTLSREAWMLLIASAVSLLLAMWVWLRWRQIARCTRRTTAANGQLAEIVTEARQLAGLRKEITLRVTAEAMSPAVCGLFRPVILLPQSLIEKLTPSQLRAVLLHELIHLRRRDVWVNCAQTLLQIVYWWHPLLWVANARVRRVREEAVDDAVMCALSAEAEVYAPTLLEVAKLAFVRPLAGLGLVGILESRSALRHRIERLLNFPTPRRAGVSMMSVICLAAFTALAIPMGEPPARPAAATDELATEKLIQYKAKVDPEVFTRNIQARADGTLHTTNDDLNAILASVMDEFNVDCTGERAIQFDPATGEVTAQNTSEALGVLDEVVQELNLKGGEHILNPPHGLKQVSIEARFYLMSPEDLTKLPLTAESLHREGEFSPWWEYSPGDATNLRQQLKDAGIKPAEVTRIETSHGIMASLFLGDGTNDIRWECVPFIHGGMINFTVLARTTGKYAPRGKRWPEIAGHTNCAIFSQITVPSGGAGILRAGQVGAQRELVVLLSAKTSERVTKKDVPMLGDLPEVGWLFRSPQRTIRPTNVLTYTFRMDPETLTQRLRDFAKSHSMNGITNRPALLMNFLTNAGVNSFPPNSFFLHEGLGRADLMLNATKEDLQKAADALGLDWKTEQALNEGTPVDSQKLHEDSNGSGTAYTPVGSSYKTNFTADASAVAQLVQDGKLLYQLGRTDEAEVKLQEALAKDPNNQAAQYYLNLVKQTRARNLAPPAGGMGRNVPGPGARPDDVTSMVRRVQDEKGPTDNAAPLNLPVPNPYASTNKVYSSPARQRIYDKLKDITFDKVAFADLQLSEVIRTLTEQTQRRDVDQLGINFILNKTKPLAVSGTGTPPAFDPATGQPISRAAEDFDLALVKINLDPGLKNVRLLDVLEAITKSADHPISYAILDYGIEFTLKVPGQVQLHTRTFRVDPNTFYMGLQSFHATNPVAGKNSSDASNQTTGNGSGANAGGTQGHGLRYGFDSTAAIQGTVMNFLNAIGVNLAAPKSVFFNDRQGTLTVRATDEDLELVEQAINTLSIAPPEVTVKVRFIEINDEDMFKPGFEWFLKMMASNGTNGLTGIITEPLFRMLLKNIQQRKGADLLNEGEVTTLSGRQANFQVIEIETNSATASGDQATNTPFGTTVDVLPQVLADGYSIQLTVIPTITERVEYPAPGNFVPTIQSGNGGIPLTGPLPLPHTRVRQLVANCTVWDGQTAVLLLERYVPHKKNVVVLVTTTIIDASGNRKNLEESVDLAQKAAAPQPAN